MTDPCPICGGTGCKTYDLMLVRWLSGRDRDHWRRVHDRLNPSTAASGTIVPLPRPPAAESIAAMRKVRECPHRSRDTGCGCSGSRCALGKGKAGLVAHRDCLACVGLAVTG